MLCYIMLRYITLHYEKITIHILPLYLTNLNSNPHPKPNHNPKSNPKIGVVWMDILPTFVLYYIILA